MLTHTHARAYAHAQKLRVHVCAPQAAQLSKERLAYQQQRISEVTANNEARQQKLETIQEQKRQTQVGGRAAGAADGLMGCLR